MKLTIMLLTAFVMNASAKVSSQTVSLSCKQYALESVFQSVEKQTGLIFIYKEATLKGALPVTIDAKNISVERFLKQVFASQPLGFDIKGQYILVYPNPPANKASSATRRTALLQDTSILRGTVVDEKGGPIDNASIIVAGTQSGTSTGTDGSFALNVPDGTRSTTIQVSSIGYQSTTLRVNSDRLIRITLEHSASDLDEAIVVGYGRQKKATLTGAVAEVKGSEILRSPNTNVANSLQGRLPGVIMNNRSGEPGKDNPSINIRGRSTTGNNSALVIIDGVEREGLGAINPNDIESISVLKDASAAIYGARAANGVILVTTKRGLANATPTINFSYDAGATGPTRNPKMADSYTFFNVYNEIEQGEGRPARYSAQELQKFNEGIEPGYANFNWYNFMVKDWTMQHRSNLSVSGGGERTKYYLSFGEVGQDGQYKIGSTKIKQYNLRSNIDVKVTDIISVGMNLAARFDNNHYPYRNMNELNSHIYLYQPNWVPYWPGTDKVTPNRDNDNIINWVSDANGYQETKITTLQTTLFGKIEIPFIKGLSLYGSGSFDPNVISSKTWQLPTYVYYKDANSGELVKGRSGKGPNNPDLLARNDLGSRLYLTSRLNYDRKFGSHTLGLMMAYEQQTTNGNYLVAYRSDFVSTALPEIFAGSSDKNKQGNDGSATQGARKNYFGRISYNYGEKYLAEVTIRRDGSPNFPASNRWGTFPGVSAGYVISKESFFNQIQFVSNLKIRASYGVMGNDLINPFQYLQTFSYGNNYVIGNNDVNGLVQTGAPNPNITWETAKTSNLGLDASLWNGKLDMTFELFKTTRSNILTKRAAVIPGYTGLVLPDENIGIVENEGLELMLSHANRVGELRYNISGNFAYAKNRVVFSDEQPAAEPYQFATGRPIGAGLYYKAIGVFKDQADIDKNPHFINARPGDLKYEDVNGDKEINSLDRIRINETATPQITYAFNANFQYKNFDFSFLLQGQANARVSFGEYFPVMSYSLGNFLAWRANDRWTPQNTDASMPRASYELFNNNTNSSTQWLIDASFLKLRNVQLGYNLPNRLISKMKMKKLRVYISGSNLLVLADKMKDLGFDPETTDYWYYPPQRVINVGVTVTF
ncbi:MAG TPA: TonB-dependent receptor [Chryseolinea sp.]|nr:TonB-dependent receptor [Chryseolinea sp.]